MVTDIVVLGGMFLFGWVATVYLYLNGNIKEVQKWKGRYMQLKRELYKLENKHVKSKKKDELSKLLESLGIDPGILEELNIPGWVVDFALKNPDKIMTFAEKFLNKKSDDIKEELV